jgi:TIR domain/Trypsin-like peptidase domain
MEKTGGRGVTDWEKLIVRVWSGSPKAGGHYRGTAFVVSGRHLLTARHVVSDLDWQRIRLSDGAWPGGLVGLACEPELHPTRDIALLTLARALDNIVPLSFSTDPQEGDEVLLAGYGTDDGQLDRLPLTMQSYDGVNHTFIAHTFVGTGMSGGPAMRGRTVIGLTQARDTDKNRTYVIPVSAFAAFLQSTVELPPRDLRGSRPVSPEGDRSAAKGRIQYDVFLSYNSADKAMVCELRNRLAALHQVCWFDEDQLQPGIPWQKLLESGIRSSKSVAVIVGDKGLGPWENEEMEAALRLAVRDKRPVIPVILPGAESAPELPLFLSNRTWVDFRPGFDDANLAKLIWGITGQKSIEPAGITPDGPRRPDPPCDCRQRLQIAGRTAALLDKTKQVTVAIQGQDGLRTKGLCLPAGR